MSPTLSQIRLWDTDHLEHAADYWAAQAQNWESVFTTLFHTMARPGGQPWDGDAADQAQLRAYLDRLRVIGVADRLRAVAATARAGAGRLRSARTAVLDIVEDATSAGFDVDEQLFVSCPGYLNPVQAAARQQQALTFAARLRAAVIALVELDDEVAGQVAAATGEIDVGDFGDGAEPAGFPENPTAPRAVAGEPGAIERRAAQERLSALQDAFLESAEEVAATTSDEVGQATLEVLRNSPDDASPGLRKWLEGPRIGQVEIPGLTRMNLAVGTAAAVPSVIKDISSGKPAGKVITSKAAGLASGLVAGAAADAALGAAFGSVVPGAGTAVGLAVGFVGGLLIGSFASSAVETATETVYDGVARAVG